MSKFSLVSTVLGVEKRVSLKGETYFGLGGPAKYFYRAKCYQDLLDILSISEKEKIKTLVVGGGSNIVVSDKGWPGLFIKFENKKPSKKDLKVENGELVCEASLPLSYLVKFTVYQGLVGLEKLSGIPGCVGGAVVGNAGAYGASIIDNLVWVEVFDGKKVRRLSKLECRFDYRDSIFKHKSSNLHPWLVLRVAFSFNRGDKKALTLASKKIIKIRQGKFPNDLLCPGSFFKNIPVKEIPKKILPKIDQTKIIEGKLPAGVLLEAIGAKGQRVGGIIVSDFHANFILNTGKGKQSEVKKLAAKLKAQVRKKFGIELEEEVRYVG